MRLLMYELKKIWDWRTLLVIAVFGVLTWFTVLADGVDSFDSLTRHGSFGSYQLEMFEVYGNTLEPEELADFNFPERFAEIYEEADKIVVENSVFVENGIGSFREFLEWIESELPIEVLEGEDFVTMNSLLEGGNPETLEEWYASPMMRFQSLRALEIQYAHYQNWLESFYQFDSRPVVRRAAQEIMARGNDSLIHYSLNREFSFYAMLVGIFVIVGTIIFTAPVILIDRTREVHYLQYSSGEGRKILR